MVYFSPTDATGELMRVWDWAKHQQNNDKVNLCTSGNKGTGKAFKCAIENARWLNQGKTATHGNAITEFPLINVLLLLVLEAVVIRRGSSSASSISGGS